MDPLRQTDPLADGPIKAGGSGNERAPRLELPASDGPRNERFPALTGIRAVAAFLVFFHHLPLHLRPGFLMGLQNSFYSGVSFFFVLSGFLIAWRYYEEVRLSGSWLLQYFGNRFARIYPVYFLLLTIVVLLMKNADPIFLLQNYTLTHNLFFLFPSHGIAIAPSWSLTVEECFYLLAPFIFILSRKYKLGLPFFLTLVLLILLLLTYGRGLSLQQSWFPIFIDTFFGRFFEFYTGIWLALLVRKKERKELAFALPAASMPLATSVKSVTRPTSAGTRQWTLTGIAGIALLYIPLTYVSNKDSGLKFPVMVAVNNFLLPFPIAALYFGLVFENSLVRRFLSSAGMRLAGRSSYVFYLLHLPLIDWLGTPYLRRYFGGSTGGYNLYVGTIFLLTLAMSVALFVGYEEPLNRRIRKSFHHRGE